MLYVEATLSTPSLSERGANAVNKVCRLQPNLFEQHARLKSQYPGVILLLRVGDFYEAFDDDADAVARVCSLAKSTRADHRMAGFPHMHLDRFLTALVRAGFRVATCEPVLDKPLTAKPEVVRWNRCAKEEG
jgi:DNA mismatch repair protein MutS